MLQAKLKVVGGRHHGRVIPLATKKFLIGREQDCHLRPNSELVSRHHCVFSVDDYSVHIRDLGSTNGTFVNDQRVRGEVLLNSGDRIRVGKLDFELAIGEPAAAGKAPGDSSHLLPGLSSLASTAETAPIAATDTSFEMPVPIAPEDTGSSIIAESATPVPVVSQAAPPAPPAPSVGDSTVLWSPPASPSYSPEMYPQMGMPYPQGPYQPAYPYMPPGMGYQPQYHYPQMPMSYPGMYPQMNPQMGMYPQAAPSYNAPAQPPAATPEPQNDDSSASILNVRLPDPKTTGAKAAAPPPPPPAPEPPKQAPGDPAAAAAEGDPFAAGAQEKKPEPPPVKPSEGAADILKRYTQRRPV